MNSMVLYIGGGALVLAGVVVSIVSDGGYPYAAYVANGLTLLWIALASENK